MAADGNLRRSNLVLLGVAGINWPGWFTHLKGWYFCQFAGPMNGANLAGMGPAFAELSNLIVDAHNGGPAIGPHSKLDREDEPHAKEM